MGDNNTKELLDHNKFKEIALDIIEKKKQNSLNLSGAAPNLVIFFNLKDFYCFQEKEMKNKLK